TYTLATHQMSKWLRMILVASLVLLYLPPLHLFLLSAHSYAYVAIPILVLFLSCYAELKKISLAIRTNLCPRSTVIPEFQGGCRGWYTTAPPRRAQARPLAAQLTPGLKRPSLPTATTLKAQPLSN